MTITQIPDWKNLSDQQALDYLSEVVETPTNHQITFGEMASIEAIGMAGMALVAGTVKAAAADNPILDTAYIALSTTGLNLSSPERLEQVDALADAGSWPSEVRDAIKAMAIHTEANWQSLGYESLPDLQQIAEERAAALHAARVTNATALFSERMKPGDDPAAVMAQAWEDAG